jgi:hypothetical protein
MTEHQEPHKAVSGTAEAMKPPVIHQPAAFPDAVGMVTRRFRNDSADTIVWNEVGHAISPGQDVHIALPFDHKGKPPKGLTETTHTARQPVPAGETAAQGPSAVLASEPGLTPAPDVGGLRDHTKDAGDTATGATTAADVMGSAKPQRTTATKGLKGTKTKSPGRGKR